MIGYKAIVEERGILRAKSFGGLSGDIFEIDIPKQNVMVGDDVAYSENGYSFCNNIEDVLCWEDYLECKKEPWTCRTRLFEVDTLDEKVIRKNKHNKASKICVRKEVTKNEILEYFCAHPDRVPKQYDDKLKAYKSFNWIPYEVVLDSQKIEKLMVDNCFLRTQSSVCKQMNSQENIELCKTCLLCNNINAVFYYIHDFYYLEARRKIYDGCVLEDIEEYKYLKISNRMKEKESLELIYDSITKNETK